MCVCASLCVCMLCASLCVCASLAVRLRCVCRCARCLCALCVCEHTFGRPASRTSFAYCVLLVFLQNSAAHRCSAFFCCSVGAAVLGNSMPLRLPCLPSRFFLKVCTVANQARCDPHRACASTIFSVCSAGHLFNVLHTHASFVLIHVCALFDQLITFVYCIIACCYTLFATLLEAVC